MHARNQVMVLNEVTPEAVERWVAAAMAVAAALREHDSQLYPDGTDPAAMEAAHRLHDEWRHWLDDAHALVARIDRLREHDDRVRRSPDLEYAIARAEFVIRDSPERVIELLKEAESCKAFTMEELRRELGLPDRAGCRH